MTPEERKANVELQLSQRKKYLNKELTHEEYYLWLSDWLGLTDALIPYRPEAVARSKDEHLNDLPLAGWDAMHGFTREAAYRKGIAWSMSDNVCCLKAMARRRSQK